MHHRYIGQESEPRLKSIFVRDGGQGLCVYIHMCVYTYVCVCMCLCVSTLAAQLFLTPTCVCACCDDICLCLRVCRTETCHFIAQLETAKQMCE